ncbi:hypothetical protein CANARDRAFT_8285 [[Candida] arabinofermentans NRRL YB-2248]|uniref:NADH:flavin oxidoreductase/NADH oxidase N-terminal domain-containing protein n=1 Tax=[Candida] arabinofermentans NRRL YB-2248 TaxID=983967 RepID=A0A1E4SYY4_9ASCO|nr:hypothetical protein CANARDRAFT_8285 [[Candida] arabinofermentans NRRL YB-2248]
MVELKDTNLFKPITLGETKLEHRFVYAPTTRFRATKDWVVSDAMATYYEERAESNGGLLIAEATHAAPLLVGAYNNTPGCHTELHAKAYKKLIDRVHAKGSKFAIQLWALGRVADPKLMKELGKPLVAPSAIFPDEATEKACIDAGNELKALTLDEIEEFKKEYINSVKLAINVANADIVEIHGAHGYMLDQFIQESSNQRTDKYGGSIENRARLTLELIDLAIEAVGASKIGIRLSPYAKFQGSTGVDSKTHPIAQFGYILSELQKRASKGDELAYISVVEPTMNGIFKMEDERVFNTSWIQEIWKGKIIRAGNYLHQQDLLIKDVNADDRTLIAASRYWTSNPDLIRRLKEGLELNHYKRDEFYVPGSIKGYLGWNKYGESKVADDDKLFEKEVIPLVEKLTI